ncbi:16S rRNA (guanine(527)-N(7))-methyltransferase RsmG [Shewanella oneidensis MR-1]|uniref:Ribosomal RNA small subunit methyltransferase G n=1 Tax=Shewanella oneidensis (strain ATCC 700550 / JCM 31522 / CIP 106686 / LMG 19005 / NCIMB 14063 / MR-1) TaxID=211586 RepID=RSMG_SHEON|nr:16S rRNA (guanine(527)-N(7))-methyltransferase RsmG [Shewanella oneidensis]Q8E8B0.1 RecName: Full=Ribosomal RNA small subunit methyltransferase G; AltName: Full=16S rRNA 7-methylguanosine methyltransferase; Short=16S rRNA m7G methyltransferase [Shewanella oneidensis MR-1]AAN57716.1 16S rRNA (guanine527-N7)-methyltransferase RsmG [Shewanella oneidensis MR-1]MDX5998011.1 16S rRNA (guanine(527)-N(7))-methyltransferase RsmG [Shewanella oneidensis]MEE2027714.1 Ribosomal RNA small subunit methyltr
MLSAQLEAYLAEINLPATAEQKKQLLDFVGMLNKWNKAYNLTSVRDPEIMLVRHIMDSLVVSKHLQGDRFIDVGTGPGLPGIPLAIMNPDKTFVLLDSLGKRIRFQKQVAFELGIHNVSSIESRVEAYQPEQKFDGVLSRAFASIHDMLTWCHHLPAEHGQFYALKGQLSDDEMQHIPTGFAITETIELKVPRLDEQRHLLKIIKE